MSDEIEIYKCKTCDSTNENEHTAWCILCECCESRFKKHDVQVYKTDTSFVACQICGLQALVSFYRLNWEKSKDSEERMKAEVNLFKTVLLRPETMSAIAEDPTSDQPSKFTIQRRLQGIESFTIDQMQYWLETFELYARGIADLLGKKASREEIKQHLQDKTKKSLEASKKESEKRVSIESKPAVKLSPDEKAIKAMMKTFKISETSAKLMYQNLNKAGTK